MIVIDTHALIWLIEGDRKLGALAAERINAARSASSVLIPAVVPWEIGLLTVRGKIELTFDPLRWIELTLMLPGFSLAPLTPEIAIGSASLEWSHRDPADRMMVSTAIVHDAMLLTADEKILAYAAAGHVKVIDARD